MTKSVITTPITIATIAPVLKPPPLICKISLMVGYIKILTLLSLDVGTGLLVAMMMAVVVSILLELSITRVVVVVTMMVDTSMISTDDVITDVIMLSVILGKVLLTNNGSDEVIMTALVVDTMLVIASVNVNAPTEVIMELISTLVISIVDITAVGKLGMTVIPVVLPAISLFISIVLVDDEILSDIVSFIMSTGDILMVMLSFCDAVSN